MTNYIDNHSDNPFAVASATRSVSGPILRTFALVGLCCLAVYGLHLASRYWLIGRLSFGLAEHPAHIQSERLAMLAEFGPLGLPSLVEATISEDAALSQNAYRTLAELQGRWVTGAADDSPTMNLALVAAIANVAPQCPPERRSLLSNLLNQTILETVDSPHKKDQQSYTQGQSLLAMLGPGTGLDRQSALRQNQTTGQAIANRRVSLDVSSDSQGDLQADSRDAFAGVSTNNLLDPGSLLPPLPTRLLSTDMDPDGLGTTLNENPNWLSANQRLSENRSGNPGTDNNAEMAESNPLVRDARFESSDFEVGPIDQITENPLATYDVRSVIDFLASPQPSLVKAAENELKDRKLTVADLEMARRLTSPNPEVRMAMIKELPSRTDVDPRTWLIWLSSDLERMVRLEAISVLGSMDDPEIKSALRDRLQIERDMIVAARLRRVLGLR